MLFLLLLTETFPETSPAVPSFPEGSGIDFTWMFLKVLLAMILVCGAAFAVIKYLLPRTHYARRAKDSQIEIVERLTLEPKKNLYILKIARKSVLVGTSETSIQPLLEWEERERGVEPSKE